MIAAVRLAVLGRTVLGRAVVSRRGLFTAVPVGVRGRRVPDRPCMTRRSRHGDAPAHIASHVAMESDQLRPRKGKQRDESQGAIHGSNLARAGGERQRAPRQRPNTITRHTSPSRR